MDDSDDAVQELRKMNALLRFYLHIEPNELTDEEFAKRWHELKFALEYERKRHTF